MWALLEAPINIPALKRQSGTAAVRAEDGDVPFFLELPYEH